MIYGLVVNATSVTDPNDLSDAEPVPGATILVDGRFTITAGDDGYFETWVEPGDVALLASAEGFEDSGNDCVVVEGGAVECNIFLPLETDTQQDGSDQSDVSDLYHGCSSVTPAAGSSGMLWLLLALGLLTSRRRRQQ